MPDVNHEQYGCPLERKFAELLQHFGVEYTRPERDSADPTNLDFYIPALKLYVEIKRFHTDRINHQLSKVPLGYDVMVLQGNTSVDAFRGLLRFVGRSSIIWDRESIIGPNSY